MMDDAPRLPTALWLEPQLRRIEAQGRFYYLLHRGAYASGVVLLRINLLNGSSRVLIQMRDEQGEMGWIAAMDVETVEDSRADAYISRAITRDPDLWVVEVEDRDGQNPLEGKLFSL